MKLIKLLFSLILLILTCLVLHYYLPGRDIVQVVGIEVSREDYKKIDQSKTGQNRDVRYVNAVWPNGNPRVYRNEDAVLYLKFDSGNLNAQAQKLGNLHAAQQDEVWVAVRHYGWRIPVLSMYPNALTVKEVESPDVRLIPWFNIVFFIVLFVILLWLWSKWRKFKTKRIEPVTDKIGDVAEDIGDEIKEKREESRSFFRRWFGSSK